MKKTTAHGRKLRRLGITSSRREKAVAAVVTRETLALAIQAHRPYDDPANVVAADAIMAGVRLAFHRIAHGLTPGDDKRDIGNVSEHIGTGQIRALEIGRGDAGNAVMHTLNLAAQALHRAIERHGRTGAWGFDGPGLIDLKAGIEAGEDILRASTPAQMDAAQRRFLAWRTPNPQAKESA